MVARDWLSRRMVLLVVLEVLRLNIHDPRSFEWTLADVSEGFERNGTRGTRFLSR